MRRPCRFAVLVVALLALCPAFSIARQASVAIQKPDPSPAPPRTEADKTLAEIMKGTDGKLDPVAMVPRLEQFIKDNPGFPRLESVYSSLLAFSSMSSATAEKAVALADQALARFPDSASIRTGAIRAKFSALRALKKDDAIKELGQKLLESEANPSVLQSAAAFDRADSVKLLEKAIAERRKNENATATPTVADLRWAYAQSLNQAGRSDEGLKLSMEVMDEARKEIAELEALPKSDPKRGRVTMLQRNVSSRYQTLASGLAAAGDYQKALDYIALAEQSGGDNPFEAVFRYEDLRAGIYAKAGKPDLELESYVRSFAARMDVRTRDKIRDLAPKNGKKPEEVFARAREIRNQNALAISGFELKTLDGPTVTLDTLRASAKVTLVNFFFPT